MQQYLNRHLSFYCYRILFPSSHILLFYKPQPGRRVTAVNIQVFARACVHLFCIDFSLVVPTGSIHHQVDTVISLYQVYVWTFSTKANTIFVTVMHSVMLGCSSLKWTCTFRWSQIDANRVCGISNDSSSHIGKQTFTSHPRIYAQCLPILPIAYLNSSWPGGLAKMGHF